MDSNWYKEKTETAEKRLEKGNKELKGRVLSQRIYQIVSRSFKFAGDFDERMRENRPSVDKFLLTLL